MKTLAVVGCGKLGRIVARAIRDGILPEYRLVAVYSRTYEKTCETASMVEGCVACRTIDELLAMRPDYIAEAASPAAMREFAIPALRNGSSIVTISIGAFADDSFYDEVREAALFSGTRVYVASGATGGFDVLRTAALMGEVFAGEGGDQAQAEFFNEKGPDALKGTPVYEDSLQNESKVVFEGTAREAIAAFPTKVNVTVAASRASVGPSEMKVSIKSTPGFVGDTQRVEIRNRQVRAVIDIYSETSEIAGWSMVSVLQNIMSPIVF